MDEDREKTPANDVVSPKNTERLYGAKADPPEHEAGKGETVEDALPEDFTGVDQEIGSNIFPSHSARHPDSLADDS